MNKYNAEHPARKKAIEILEKIADKMGNEDMFDCADGNTLWYDLEDIVTNIIDRKENMNTYTYEVVLKYEGVGIEARSREEAEKIIKKDFWKAHKIKLEDKDIVKVELF